MEMPKPSTGHLKLERLAGHWSGKETMYPSQWDPRGGVWDGSTDSRIGLGGFALISEYHQERDGVETFSGHAVMTYSSDTGLYTMHWFDCMGSRPEVFTGKFEEGVLTVAHSGPGMHARLTYDLSHGPRTMLTQMEMSPDGVNWNKMFDGHYEKK